MKRTITVTVAGLLVFGLGACGGSTSPANDQAAPAPSASAIPAPAASAAKMDAQAVTKALAAAGLPAKISVVVDEDNDRNNLIGRPGQYTSKVAFTDNRVDRSQVLDDEKGSIGLGGGVEVFASEHDAKARADYVSSITKSMAIFSEYLYQQGPIVLRLSNVLKPSQAEAYKAALANIG